MRAFVAVKLPPPLVATLGACRTALLDAEPSWRHEKWVADEALHMTLRFLSDVGEETLDLIAARLCHTLRDVAPFELDFTCVAAMPHPRAASHIWAESPDPDRAAKRLAATVDQAVAELAVPEPPRRFRAHVTLCRARNPRVIGSGALALAATPLVSAAYDDRSVSVVSGTLFTSILTPAGPVYREVATVPLGG